MNRYAWNTAWETGIEPLDEQHKEMLQLLQSLALVMKEPERQSEQEDILIRLRDHAFKHFDFEENLMVRHGFPGLAHHRRIHDDTRRHLNFLASMYPAYKQMVPSGVLEYLLNWLLEHISEEDFTLAAFIRGTGE